MKKIIAMLLALVMVFALCACGEKQAATPTAEPAAETPAEATEAPVDGAKPEGYPSGNTVTLVCSSSAGSATDTAARAFIDCMTIEGANIVVENISGGSQTVGTTDAVGRAADGMTMVMMAPAGMFGQPAIQGEDLAYNIDDLRILCNVSPDVIGIVVVRPDSKITTPEEFLDYIKNNEFKYGIPNIGGYGHIAMGSVLMQLDCLANGSAVNYDGSQNVMQAVLNGELDFAVLDDNFIRSYVESGELKAIVALYEGSSPLVDCPGISEYGITGMAGMVGIKWLAVRADTPDDIAKYLREQAVAAITSEKYQSFLEANNYGTLDVVYTEEELAQIKADTFAAYSEVLTALGLA